MSDVPAFVRNIVEDTFGKPLEVGKRYDHPEDGIIEITSGQFWGRSGVSNFWYWTVIETGATKHGYGDNWPEVET